LSSIWRTSAFLGWVCSGPNQRPRVHTVRGLAFICPRRASPMLHREVVTFALTHRPESVTPHRSQTRRLKRVIFVIFSMLNADRKRTLAVRFSTAAFEMPQIFVARQVQWPAAGPPLTTPNLELSASENRARWLHPPKFPPRYSHIQAPPLRVRQCCTSRRTPTTRRGDSES
jgi:hypothetical protein